MAATGQAGGYSIHTGSSPSETETLPEAGARACSCKGVPEASVMREVSFASEAVQGSEACGAESAQGHSSGLEASAVGLGRIAGNVDDEDA